MPPHDTKNSQQRMDACLTAIPRTLNANINPAFTAAKPQANVSASHRAFRYQSPPTEDSLTKRHNLRKDEMKSYVEKALALHDARGGMPVVSSPIWGSQPSSKR